MMLLSSKFTLKATAITLLRCGRDVAGSLGKFEQWRRYANIARLLGLGGVAGSGLWHVSQQKSKLNVNR